MSTRLGQIADRTLEAGWLAAVLLVPLYFNVYSSRVFEPDKISTLRSLVLVMLVAWLVKVGEAGWRAWRGTASASTPAISRSARGAAAVSSVAASATPAWLPSWLGFLRVPMALAILLYALAYLISSIFTVTPDATWWGSYQRLQGTYSQYSYMLLGLMVMANLRTRPQLNRLVNFMLLTSIPVAMYGFAQALRIDPLPWAGDTATRVASSMGNAIFVAAWLIMVVPFAIYRLMTGISAAYSARHDAQVQVAEAEAEPQRGRSTRRVRPVEVPSYSWAVVANGAGAILTSLLFFYMVLKMMAGLPYPDGRTWWLLPFAILVYGFVCWWIERLGRRQDDPSQVSLVMPLVGVALFFVAFIALTIKWSITDGTFALNLDFDGNGLLWALFFTLLWGSLAAALYALAGRERRESYTDPDRGLMRASLNVGYGVLVAIQLFTIYLTQSRGPWLGLGAGLVTFMVSLWLIGRSRSVGWMRRIGGVASAIVVAGALFVAALNIPNSPLGALSSLPGVGRGIERLSTLTRTEDGTGKVRRLIWQGATQLVVSDPGRSLIGWGPEAMYVAYNRFYPAELSQVELRNATPDRSHNVEFDHLVTTGALGLLAYYFLIGSFFFFALRLVKRARSTLDQLFGVTLIAAVASHFIEIQTGIQIASTWTYFYLIIGMMVAFGYYMNDYLRPQQEAAAEAVVAPGRKATVTSEEGMPEEAEAPAARALPVAAGAGAGTGPQGRSASTTVQMASGGKGTTSAQGARRGGDGAAGATGRGSSGSGGNGRGTPAGQGQDGRRRTVQPPGAARGQSGGGAQWARSPIMLAVYAVVSLIALIIMWTVNVATVQADTLFKQAQAYDGAGRYFEEKDQQGQVFPGSLTFYNKALELQPNQDYYYLFKGRTYLEAAKAVDQEPYNRRAAVRWSQDANVAAQEKQAEKVARLTESERILKQANALSPINTDHYANLGRLYLYWADATGANDRSKAPLAVQWMEEATRHTPGNAQLWDELAVSYSRNNQFDKAVEALLHSRLLDPTYARTPHIRGQLYQERAENVKSLLMAGQPLPTDGETDFGKLVLEAGRAYSETVQTDPAQLIDAQYQSRLDFFLRAAQPFTNSNSSLTEAQLRNVLTDTLVVGLSNEIKRGEADFAGRVRSLGGTAPGERVDDSTLQSMWASADWTRLKSDGTTEWSSEEIRLVSTSVAKAHYGLGILYRSLGQTDAARAELTRALTLSPAFGEAQTALEELK